MPGWMADKQQRLAKIREAFVLALTGMFHGRIRYPSEDDETDGEAAGTDKGAATPKQMHPTIDDKAKISGRAGR